MNSFRFSPFQSKFLKYRCRKRFTSWHDEGGLKIKRGKSSIEQASSRKSRKAQKGWLAVDRFVSFASYKLYSLGRSLRRRPKAHLKLPQIASKSFAFSVFFFFFFAEGLNASGDLLLSPQSYIIN